MNSTHFLPKAWTISSRSWDPEFTLERPLPDSQYLPPKGHVVLSDVLGLPLGQQQPQPV